MRTTVDINSTLLADAKRLTGIADTTAVVHAGLAALVARESARRLAVLGGTMEKLRAARRRRSTARV